VTYRASAPVRLKRALRTGKSPRPRHQSCLLHIDELIYRTGRIGAHCARHQTPQNNENIPPHNDTWFIAPARPFFTLFCEKDRLFQSLVGLSRGGRAFVPRRRSWSRAKGTGFSAGAGVAQEVTQRRLHLLECAQAYQARNVLMCEQNTYTNS
jgi:hypothetical protein